MKKIVCTLLLIALSKFNWAQEAEKDVRKIRIGLKAAPTFCWFTPKDKLTSNDGITVKSEYSLIADWNFSNNFWLSSGVSVSYFGAKTGFTRTSYYNFINYESTAPNSLVLVKSRKYNLQFIDLPITVKMKTKEIGSMTYFAQTGLNLGFRFAAKANDVGTILLGSSNDVDFNKINVNKDVAPIRVALNVGTGVEYNLTGTTSLIIGANFSSGFTNILLNDYVKDASGVAYKFKASSNYVALSVGVLF